MRRRGEVTVPAAERGREERGSPVVWRVVAPGCGLALLGLCILLWRYNREAYMDVLWAWGVPALSHPFADWEAVVSLMRCASRGVDVYVASRCGLFSYSPLWAWAAMIPPGPVWRDAIGLLLDVTLILSFGFAYRPRSWREAAVYTAACVSSVTAFAEERANVDIVLFLMMVIAAALASGRPVRRTAAYATIVVAGLLKFYPVAGLLIAMRETTGRFVAAVLVALAAVAAVLFAIRTDTASLVGGIPGGRFGLDAFGASNVLYLLLGRDPSRIAWDVSFATLGLCGLAASVSVARRRGLARAVDRLDARNKITLIVGAAIVVGCFIVGQNIAYRAVFLVLVVAGLIPLRRAADDEETRTRLLRLTAGVIALMWSPMALSVFYPHYSPTPVIVVLAREAVWWWVIATLLAVLMIFAAQSKSLEFMKVWLVDGLKVGATGGARS